MSDPMLKQQRTGKQLVDANASYYSMLIRILPMATKIRTCGRKFLIWPIRRRWRC